MLNIIQERLGLKLADWATAYQLDQAELEAYENALEVEADSVDPDLSHEIDHADNPPSIDSPSQRLEKPKGKWEGDEVEDWWND